jgi:hypothetical protein
LAAALTMGLTFAHTLELPQKLGYDAGTWTRIQQSFYLWFGLIGGAVEVAAVIAAVVFAVRTRGRPGGHLATAGAEVTVNRRARSTSPAGRAARRQAMMARWERR